VSSLNVRATFNLEWSHVLISIRIEIKKSKINRRGDSEL